MIKIRPSPTADTRTCDWSKVTKETLYQSSEQHISDVREGLAFFARRLGEAGFVHDHDKLSAIDHFHADFQTGFKQTGWWDNHRRVNRHHLTEADGIPEDVNLIDVLDYITDCVMAGMARSGSVRPLTIAPDLLQRAFDNTAALLIANVEVAAAPPAPAPTPAESATTDTTLAFLDQVVKAARAGYDALHCEAKPGLDSEARHLLCLLRDEARRQRSIWLARQAAEDVAAPVRQGHGTWDDEALAALERIEACRVNGLGLCKVCADDWELAKAALRASRGRRGGQP